MVQLEGGKEGRELATEERKCGCGGGAVSLQQQCVMGDGCQAEVAGGVVRRAEKWVERACCLCQRCCLAGGLTEEVAVCAGSRSRGLAVVCGTVSLWPRGHWIMGIRMAGLEEPVGRGLR